MLEKKSSEENEQKFLENVTRFSEEKKTIQDHLLERTNVVSEEIVEQIVRETQLSNELAKIAQVLDFEYDLPKKLVTNYFQSELVRLQAANYDLPDIYSFRVRFAIEEGFWIKYLTIDFPQLLLQKMSKLQSLDRSLFGDMRGDKEDAPLYLLERVYLCNEYIRPVLHTWVKEHQRSNYYDAVSSFTVTALRKAYTKAEAIIEELLERLETNLESIATIINELKAAGWILKAKNELEELQKAIRQCKSDPRKMNWRVAAELVLENRIVLGYNQMEKQVLDMALKQKAGQKQQITKKQFLSHKKEQLITDKITLILSQIDPTADEKENKEIIKELVDELFTEGLKTLSEKPTVIALNVLTRFLKELAIERTHGLKLRKQFEQQVMYSLSAMGRKDFPTGTVEEKIEQQLQTMIVELIFEEEQPKKQLAIINRTKEQQQYDMQEQEQATVTTETSAEEQYQTTSMNYTKSIDELSDKELWIVIRDEYLKSLYDHTEELLAGAKVLKKFSLAQGLLLTDGDATAYLSMELQKQQINMQDANQEQIDKTICKIILQKILQQKNE
jgi:hypothetical protein